MDIPQKALAANTRAMVVNQVVETAFKASKSSIIASANERWQKGKIYQGVFFKGEAPKIKGIAKILASLNSQIIKSPKGFMIVLGEGEYKQKISLEFLDFLTGKIKISSEDSLLKTDYVLQLRKDMSYLELLQEVMRPAIRPLLEKKSQQLKKTSFSNPLDLLIAPAWGQEKKTTTTRV